MRYLTVDEVVLINHVLLKTYSPEELAGIKSVKLLDSAVNRPKQSALGNDAYSTVFNKAAALFESLAQNHVFQNANKRTAFVAMVQFLKYNGYNFVMTEKDATEFTISVVMHKLKFEQIAEKICNNCSER